MITLAPLAKTKLREIAEAEGLPLSIRVKTIGGGCSGLKADMMLDEITDEMDERFEQDGIVILVDGLSLQYLDGCTIDYLEQEFASGFSFNIPNARATCGCGSSFTP